MRQELKLIDGLRKQFTGTFVRYGKKTGFKGYPLTTILLSNVVCTASSKINCDHLWFNLTKEFDNIKLVEGDTVMFDARVKEYTKGYKGHRYDDDDYMNEHPIESDYKLSHPTKIKLIKRIK